MGCNQLWGLSSTTVVDAQQFDAPPDAPFECPALGGDPPRFSLALRQVVVQNCDRYSLSEPTGRAIALCTSSGGESSILEGPIDQPLESVAGLPRSIPGFELSTPVISPEGDELFVNAYDDANPPGQILSYRRSIDGTWTLTGPVALGVGVVSAPTQRPDRHILAYDNPTSDLTEYTETAPGTWTPLLVHSLAKLGIKGVAGIWLSHDGLRLAMQVSENGISHLAYTDRATLGDPFGAARPMSGPNVPSLFLTRDCSRFYVTGLHSVFYAPRL